MYGPRLTKILLLLGLSLVVVFLLSFVLLGDHLEALFSMERCREWFAESKPWAWLIAIGLLISDLVLPVPATGVMAATGAVYGFWLGTLISTVGSVLAGLTGYALARWAGRGYVERMSTPDEIHRLQEFFDRWGGLGIIISRLLPIFPEVLSVMAGLAPMHFLRFLSALALGGGAVSALYNYLGIVSRDAPAYGIPLVLLVPVGIWLIVILLWRKKSSRSE